MELQVLSQLEFYVAQLTLARHRNLAQYFHAVAKIKVCCIKNYCQSLLYPSFSLTNLNLENNLTAKFLLLQFKSILISLAQKNYKIFGWNKLNKDKRRIKKKTTTTTKNKKVRMYTQLKYIHGFRNNYKTIWSMVITETYSFLSQCLSNFKFMALVLGNKVQTRNKSQF